MTRVHRFYARIRENGYEVTRIGTLSTNVSLIRVDNLFTVGICFRGRCKFSQAFMIEEWR